MVEQNEMKAKMSFIFTKPESVPRGSPTGVFHSPLPSPLNVAAQK